MPAFARRFSLFFLRRTHTMLATLEGKLLVLSRLPFGGSGGWDPNSRGVCMQLRYKEKIVERFSNAFVKDELQRVAQDGSSKFYSTTRSAVLQLLESGKNIVKLSVALAAWILYFATDQVDGVPVVPCDPKVSFVVLPRQ